MTPLCQPMQDDLKAYHDHELPLLRRLAVRRHLAHCAACREELNIMEQIGQQLQAHEDGPEAALKPALREKILTAIPNHEAASSTATPPEPAMGRTHFQNFLFQSGVVVTTVLLFVAVTATITGKKISNTFNGASSAMTSGAADSYDYRESQNGSRSYGGPAASSAAPAAAPAAKSSALSNMKALPLAKRQAQTMPGVAYDSKFKDSGNSGGTDTSTLPSSLRRVHQEARITVAVAELEEKSNSVISLVKSSGGFIANNTLVTGADGLKSATLTVRVPVRRFETVLAEIGKLGDVKAKNITGEDITEQFSDAQQADIVLASELSVKESMLKAALLKAERAEKEGKPFSNNWQLRTEVRRLRIEAAQARARLDLLKKISDLANIEVELREKPRTASEGGFTQQLSDTSRAAMESFLLAARLPIMLLIWVVAYAPLWLPLLLIYRFASRAYQRKLTRT